MAQYALDERLNEAGGRFSEVTGLRVASDFGDPVAEYEAALMGAGLYDARQRGLIQLTGRDRAAWLNNLVTNVIKTLVPGEGNYAFATSGKGRILFDLNMLVLADAIWLDLDRRAVPAALAHFEKYHITEDVELRDRSDEFVRLALVGPKGAEIAEALGAVQAPAMAALGSTSVPLVQKQRLLVRHDFAGVFGVELYVEAADALACWDRLLQIGAPVDLKPVGRTAIETLRIEAGIPVYGQDIDDEVLPAETQQIERAISYVKGCYLGQEVVERMRARGSLARKLVGLRLTDKGTVKPGDPIRIGDTPAGRITSTCESPALGAVIALGYLRSPSAVPGTQVRIDSVPPAEAVVVPLPFRPASPRT